MATFADLPAELLARVCRAALWNRSPVRMRTYAALLRIPGVVPVAARVLNDHCARNHDAEVADLHEEYDGTLRCAFHESGDTPRSAADRRRAAQWFLDLLCCMSAGEGVCAAVEVCGAVALKSRYHNLEYGPPDRSYHMGRHYFLETVSVLEQLPSELLKWVCERLLSHGGLGPTAIACLARAECLYPVVRQSIERYLRGQFKKEIERMREDPDRDFSANEGLWHLERLAASVTFNHRENAIVLRDGYCLLMYVTFNTVFDILQLTPRGPASRGSSPVEFPHWVSKSSRVRYVRFLQRILV